MPKFRLLNKRPLSSGLLILLVVALITLLNNQVLFAALQERLDLTSLQGAGYTITLLAMMIGVLSLFLLALTPKWLLKPLLIVITIGSAVLSYFNSELGVVFDTDMIRNVAETLIDYNTQEATELLSLPLFRYVLLRGILPSLVIVFIAHHYKPFFREVGLRMVFAASIVTIITGLVMLNFKSITYFSRENRDLRVYVTPVFPLLSVSKYFQHEAKKNQAPFRTLGQDAIRDKTTDKRIVGIMVVGETARGDHFSVNGYSRETNPLLKKQNLVNFTDTTSCGTSTAYSVPCMFSFLDANEYSPGKAARQSNVLDVLNKTGLNVVWIDNNSSCKGVCDRIDNVNLHNDVEPQSPFYHYGEYYDEILLGKVDELINQSNADILIVLHTMGSHGPTYFKRFPENFGAFKPYCTSSSPQECSDEETTNAYDNTIVYTDYILSQLIDRLKKRDTDFESFLMYASDHGESLGENGVYLHGLPKSLAPRSQTLVPFMTWFSDSFVRDRNMGFVKTRRNEATKTSHDNITHSLLGLFDVKTDLYKPELNLFPNKSGSRLQARAH